MDREAKRRALVVACALGVLAGPAAGDVSADPAPRQERGGRHQGAGGGAGRQGLDEVRAQLSRLHARAESATDAYNGAAERAGRQRRAVARVKRRIGALRRELAGYRDTAGAMARAQYRGGALPDAARLVLNPDPESFLRQVALIRKGERAALGVITTLGRKQRRLDAFARDASARWRKLERERRRKAGARRRVVRDLRRVRRVEERLSRGQRRRLLRLEDRRGTARQEVWLKSASLRAMDRKPARGGHAGARAVAFALNQLGKDYQWGATGPRTFDCSGLTMRAWQAAGRSIPRTSQGQWRGLPHVPASAMRPGDLIVYRRDASHVALYVGGGRMVHAPRTGRQVSVAGAGSMPILGVVRPGG